MQAFSKMGFLANPKANSFPDLCIVSIAAVSVVFFLCFPAVAQPLFPSQSNTLLRLQRLLEYPPPLAGWSNATAFCYLPPSPSLSISCSGGRVTELSIVGDASRPLSANFSSDSFFTTLSRLPDLTTISLVSLGLWGPLSAKVHRFSSLQVLNLSSNYYSGVIPPEISNITSLQNLVLSRNSFNGTVPDLHPLTALLQLDLSGNRLGPGFPSLSTSLVTLFLNNNSFRDKLPDSLASLNHLQKLDLSSNHLNGRIPAFLFSLPSVQYLDLSENRLTGELPANLSCSNRLGYADISNNLIVGGLPSCIQSNSSTRLVLSSGNCLNSRAFGFQHPSSYCNQGALAAVLPSANKISGSKSNLGLIFAIVGGVIAGTVLVGLLVFLIFKKLRSKLRPEDREANNFFSTPSAGKYVVQVASRSPAEARYMSHAIRIGTLGQTPYRVFSMEELEEATNSFDPSNLIEDGPQAQSYKGWLQDGTWVVIRHLKLRQKLARRSLHQYMDIISKLRHRHLVSIVGHCIASGLDGGNTMDSVFLVSEHITNGNLRDHLGEWRNREMMTWPQRVSAVIGVARGIQFLHTITVPGIIGNDLNIENILLDQTLTAKISNYNLPTLPNLKNNKGGSESPLTGAADKGDLCSIGIVAHGEKEDIYQLGLIILEVIAGKSMGSKNELDSLRAKLQKILADNPANLKGLADPAIRENFALNSLRTVVEVSLSCISEDPEQRPSIDDILWNLQYSVQVQDGWGSSENLSCQM
ncbi:hypothetical protein OPV22_006572 [Ensete ventricosum]|uniref:non-specific serine/threonine protein kinase n=1 Tax=Ensete ventricosum TaxID=4639 RepID=A0AAV8RL46_ENSVE|nr:hypothetical protein OPV22_006572 [Ensete ventricosum]